MMAVHTQVRSAPNSHGRPEAERVTILSTEPSRQSESLSYFSHLDCLMLPAVNQPGFNRLTNVDFMHQIIPGKIFRQSFQQASCFFFYTRGAHAINIVVDSRNGQSVPKTKAEASLTLAFSCGTRSAFELNGRNYLRSMVSRRQLQGFVRRRRRGLATVDRSPLFRCRVRRVPSTSSSRRLAVVEATARSIKAILLIFLDYRFKDIHRRRD